MRPDRVHVLGTVFCHENGATILPTLNLILFTFVLPRVYK